MHLRGESDMLDHTPGDGSGEGQLTLLCGVGGIVDKPRNLGVGVLGGIGCRVPSRECKNGSCILGGIILVE